MLHYIVCFDIKKGSHTSFFPFCLIFTFYTRWHYSALYQQQGGGGGNENMSIIEVLKMQIFLFLVLSLSSASHFQRRRNLRVVFIIKKTFETDTTQ